MRTESQDPARLPTLDGLRGVAVLAVVLYHYQTRPIVPGGLFGVDLFFVLSGFLITTLLVQEWQQTGRIDLADFYRRRCLRLLPAALAFVATYTAIVVVLSEDETVAALTANDAFSNAGLFLFQGYNWALIEDVAPAGGYAPLWSLAVEAQFSLVWPVVLLALLRGGVRLPFLLLACATLAIASVGVTFVLGEPSWHRVAFGTDVRAHQLLIGACVGILYASGRIDAGVVRSPIFLTSLALSIIVIVYMMLRLDQRYLFTEHQWLFPLFAIASAIIVVAAACSDHVSEMRVFRSPVLTWLGRRSYAIYLWHYPMGLLFAALTMEGQLLVAGGMTLAIAEVSHRLIEAPALRWRRRSQPAPERPQPVVDAGAATAAA